MDEDDVQLSCENCGWTGSQLDEDMDAEYDGSGLTWWCPSCDTQWNEG